MLVPILRGALCDRGVFRVHGWIIAALALCGLALPAAALTPAQGCTDCPVTASSCAGLPGDLGCWEGPWDWSCLMTIHGANFDEISHAALIPKGPYRGKVLLWRDPRHTNAPLVVETWIFDPATPETLLKVTDPLENDIFCSGASWDSNGELVVAGGIKREDSMMLAEETWRFLPESLEFPPIAAGIDPCQPYKIPGPVWMPEAKMSVGRYYPTLITLLAGTIHAGPAHADVPGGSSFVIGGEPTVCFPFVGNDLWQMLPPGSVPWSHVLRSDGGGVTCGPATVETYTRHPAGNPPNPIIDNYPRAFHLSTTTDGTGAQRQAKNILVAYDVFPDGGSPSNDPGDCWTIKPRYDPSSSEWQLWRTSGTGNKEHHYGSAVLMHTQGQGGRNRAFVFGGKDGYTTSTIGSEVREFVAGSDPAAGSWVTKQNGLAMPRMWCNGVALPTGEILVVGGACFLSPTMEPPEVPTDCPEIIDPGVAGDVTNAPSRLMAPRPVPPIPNVTHPYARLYHHVAVLLPDGRVFVAGGNSFEATGYVAGKYTGEIFSPPYLGHQPRPAILSMSKDQVEFGQDFTVTVDHVPGKPIERFVLLRPASVTHHFDADQRYVELEHESLLVDTERNFEVFLVSAPPDDLVPPGYSMLFAVRRTQASPLQLSPSIGKFIRFH